MAEKEKKICPFTPYIGNSQRWIHCIGEKCQMWDKKRKDCGLKK